jgi:hypothetical protein
MCGGGNEGSGSYGLCRSEARTAPPGCVSEPCSAPPPPSSSRPDGPGQVPGHLASRGSRADRQLTAQRSDSVPQPCHRWRVPGRGGRFLLEARRDTSTMGAAACRRRPNAEQLTTPNPGHLHRLSRFGSILERTGVELQPSGHMATDDVETWTSTSLDDKLAEPVASRPCPCGLRGQRPDHDRPASGLVSDWAVATRTPAGLLHLKHRRQAAWPLKRAGCRPDI